MEGHLPLQEVDILQFVKGCGHSEVGGHEVKGSDGVIHSRQENSGRLLDVVAIHVRGRAVFSEGRGNPDQFQVWSLTQFYSVDIPQARIVGKKCVFNKRTIKVCVSCC